MSRIAVLGALVLAFAGGCTARVADLTLVSTRNIDLSDARLDVRTGTRVTGSHCVYWILGLIPTGVPNIQNAIDDALTKGGGNVMVDEVTYLNAVWMVAVTRQCIRAEGTVLNTVQP